MKNKYKILTAFALLFIILLISLHFQLKNEILYTTGVHAHAYLKIVINGQKYYIPGGIGLGKDGYVLAPQHTHHINDQIHIQKAGVVFKDDMRLKTFFKIWDKRFTRACLFEYCNNGRRTVQFFVNGRRNYEFGEYLIQDLDKLEIRYDMVK